MRLHTLQSVDEDAHTLHVDRAVLGHDAAFNTTSGPKGVSHAAPWLLLVCAEERPTILAHDKSRCCLCPFHVHDRLLVRVRLDVIGLAVFTEIHSAAVGLEVLLVLGEGVVGEVVRRPDVVLAAILCKDLATELCCCPYAPGPDISADNLSHLRSLLTRRRCR